MQKASVVAEEDDKHGSKISDMYLDVFEPSARFFVPRLHLKKWGKSIVGDRSHDHKKEKRIFVTEATYR